MATACSCSVSKFFNQRRELSGFSDEGFRTGASMLRLNTLSAFPVVSHERKASSIALCADQSVMASKADSPIFRSCRVSPELQRIVGEAELSRQTVTQRVWKYIRDHNLQDPSNRRNILCNAELGQVLGVQQTDMFQLNKLLSKHLITQDASGPSSPRPKAPKVPKPTAAGKTKAPPKPVRISKTLMTFLGTTEKEMVRTEIVKRIWTYAKLHNLQDPKDGRRIICDEKLHSLLQTDSVVGIGITKFLTPHILKD